MLAHITGTVDQELLLRNEYLAAENRILKAQIKGRLLLSDAEKATLAEIAHRLGRKALEELAAVAKPDTLLAWYQKLIAGKFDGSKFRKFRGRPRVDQETERLVVRSERREAELAFGNVNSFLGAKFFAPGPRLCDLDADSVRSHLPDYAAYLAVVQPDRCTRLHAVEKLLERDTNLSWPNHVLFAIALCRPTRLEQLVRKSVSPTFNRNALLLELHQRERAERESNSRSNGPSRLKNHSWEDIGRANGIRPAAFSFDSRDDHRTRRPARIGEEYPVSHSQPRQPELGHGHDGIRRPGCNFWTRGWRQPNPRRRDYAAESVPLRAIFQHCRSRLDGPCRQLGSGQIHQNLAALVCLLFGPAKVLDHS
jgi:hypothetical protein